MSEIAVKKIELIEWLDHVSGGDNWHDVKDALALTPAHAISVGWVCFETDSFLVLIPHAGEDDVFGDLVILKSTITRREVLKPIHDKSAG